jgi:hypothetical protein
VFGFFRVYFVRLVSRHDFVWDLLICLRSQSTPKGEKKKKKKQHAKTEKKIFLVLHATEGHRFRRSQNFRHHTQASASWWVLQSLNNAYTLLLYKLSMLKEPTGFTWPDHDQYKAAGEACKAQTRVARKAQSTGVVANGWEWNSAH